MSSGKIQYPDHSSERGNIDRSVDDFPTKRNPSENGTMAKIPTIDDFVFIKPISRGAFGKVFLGHKKGKPDQLYAIKAMKKSDMVNKNLASQVVIERDAMAKVLSPFIVQLFYSIQSQQNIFLIMEYLIGGDVKSLLSMVGYFDEEMAVMYVAEVTLALEYLHRKGIIHRDLKPDNMLISNNGHIKLTDFGLSKFNMSFNHPDVPMTPRTPMTHHYQPHFEYYRTPGQILSLKSSLAFSVERPQSSYARVTDRNIPPHCPLTEVSTNHIDSSPCVPDQHIETPKLNQKQLLKQKSMRDVLLSQSVSKNMAIPMSTPGRNICKKNAPVSSLKSTLEASLNWSQSIDSDDDGTRQSTVNISDLSSIAPAFSRPNGPSVTRRSTTDLCRSDSILSADGDQANSLDDSDNVFHLVNTTDSDVYKSVELTNSNMADRKPSNCVGSVEQQMCYCHGVTRYQSDCFECRSHAKVPSRQEKLTDDTPQMHRTDESVWNSYAAKNLQALRQGSYRSEDSDSDANSKENDDPTVNRRVRANCDSAPVTRHNPRRLVKAKSFSYPSDEESDGGTRYQNHIKFARKRSFCDVEQSPVRRASSADTGLTQQLRLLRFNGCEPFSKRSSSLPRTRIRFHSGSDTWKREPASSQSETKDVDTQNQQTDLIAQKAEENYLCFEKLKDTHINTQPETKYFDAQKCLDTLASSGKGILASDNLVELSSDDKRTVEGLSDNSEQDQGEMESEHYHTSPVDAVDNIQPSEPILCGDRGIFHVVNKQISHLKKPAVSSLRSESELEMGSPDISSIHSIGDIQRVEGSSNIETSILQYSENNPHEHSRCRSPSPANHGEPCRKQTVEESPLFPPPTRTRRRSGKKTPAKIQFASIASCIPPYVYNESRSRNCSGRSDVPMTPEHITRNKVNFFTPKASYHRTPRTPVLFRSQSFACTMKTPYRTPKSVRRAPPSTEDERIFGTPDYMAPEILEKLPHGPAVDWWALGICMFEFLTGVPPFNDQTPDLVFENIIRRDIPWPEGEEALSDECRAAIENMLTVNPEHRPGAKGVKKMGAFKSINWEHLLEMTPPFVPTPDDDMDTSYFQARNKMHDFVVSDVDF